MVSKGNQPPSLKIIKDMRLLSYSMILFDLPRSDDCSQNVANHGKPNAICTIPNRPFRQVTLVVPRCPPKLAELIQERSTLRGVGLALMAPKVLGNPSHLMVHQWISTVYHSFIYAFPLQAPFYAIASGINVPTQQK